VARGVIDIKHSTDVESPPPPAHVCISIRLEGKSCSDLCRVLVLNNPAAWVDAKLAEPRNATEEGAAKIKGRSKLNLSRPTAAAAADAGGSAGGYDPVAAAATAAVDAVDSMAGGSLRTALS